MGVSWIKKGSDSAALAKQEQQEREEYKAGLGRLFRFFLKPKEEAIITFVDGELDPEGFLTPPRFYEHMVQHQGKWENIVCPEKTNPGSGEICPICKGGDRPSLVSLFTIIDHRPYTKKDGTVIPYSKKVMAVKSGVMEILAKKALKLGGLSGVTFEVSRMSDKAAAVGDVFDQQTKLAPEDAYNKFVVQRKDEKGAAVVEHLFSPAEYEKEIPYFTAQELQQKGFGGFKAQAAYNPGGGAPAAAANYKDNL